VKVSLISFGFLTLFTMQCSQNSKRDGLASDVWQRILASEDGSTFMEQLDAETLGEHQRNMQVIAECLPAGYPEPYLPLGRLSRKSIDPPLGRQPFLDENIIELGRLLFFDERLSFSEQHGIPGGVSCSSCHLPELYFTDGKSQSQGVQGDLTPRNSPGILNAAYASTLTWANPVFPILEMQARIPLFGDDPIEMGLRGREQEVLKKLLSEDANYQQLFATVFGVQYPRDWDLGLFDYNQITAALAAYERSLISFDTKFDRFLQGQEVLSETEHKGVQLFYGLAPLASGESLNCSQCHSGFLLTNSFHYVREGRYYNRQSFHNTGLYNIDGQGSYPPKNKGFASTLQLEENPALMGQFRAPALRFVASTAPYGHDGSLPSLEAVIEHYAAGGRASLSEQGQNPYIDELVKPGFRIEVDEVEALVDFFKMLE